MPLKISVITPSYNSGGFIERAIQSVLEQDYEHWEHIIIDGGSTDSTVDILKKYPHLQWISEPDKGQADAMNKGFALSSGNVVVYLNADDYFYPEAFSTVVPYFIAGAEFVVGNVYIISERLGWELLHTPRSTLADMLRHWESHAFCHNPVGYFYTRKVQEVCPFNASNDSTMDLEFLLDAAAHFEFCKVEKTLGCYVDAKNTKTDLTQSQESYWSIETFPYVDKYLELAFGSETRAYIEDRNRGYGAMQLQANQTARQKVQASAAGKTPSLDIVYQATGNHTFAVNISFSECIKDAGHLGQIFCPKGEWGALQPDSDDGLATYLEHPLSEAMLLMGFDWHSQPLHEAQNWKNNWMHSPVKKILYAQEAVSHYKLLTHSDAMYQAFLSATELADAIIYTSPFDAELVTQTGLPSLYLPFGVDAKAMCPVIPFERRKNRAYFRGQVAPFSSDTEYQERRIYLNALLNADLIDHVEYSKSPLSALDLCLQYNEYQVAVNFPSVFAGHPTRVTEGMAAGCLMITARTGDAKEDALFEHGVDLLYYHDEATLLKAVRFALDNPSEAKKIARRGREKILQKFHIGIQLEKILAFIKTVPRKHCAHEVNWILDRVDEQLLALRGQLEKGV